jgi:hypothetical protein
MAQKELLGCWQASRDAQELTFRIDRCGKLQKRCQREAFELEEDPNSMSTKRVEAVLPDRSHLCPNANSMADVYLNVSRFALVEDCS